MQSVVEISVIRNSCITLSIANMWVWGPVVIYCLGGGGGGGGEERFGAKQDEI